MTSTYVLGGAQTDFAKNWTRSGEGLYDMMAEAVDGALESAQLDPAQVGVVHVANLGGELFSGQAQLGGMIPALHPALDGVPTSRHEAACASGSVAILAAMAELEAGRYDVALVVGLELMRNLPGEEAAALLACGTWVGREVLETALPWPEQFNAIAEHYDARYGLDHGHLGRIAEINYGNARKNPHAQTRDWAFGPHAFADDDQENPVVIGHLRKQDCGRISDGATAVVLASRRFAETRGDGPSLRQLPRLKGWGHGTGTMVLADKLKASSREGHLFPHVRKAAADAFGRAQLAGVSSVDLVELHDCFTITEYVALDHLGITAPGEAWKAIEEGTIDLTGSLPVNPSGGLLGLGHPIGATGVRMVLDAARQVTGVAGDAQVEGATNAATLNIGGSFTSVVSFVVGVD